MDSALARSSVPLEEMLSLSGVRICGLMTMAPLTDDVAQTRRSFRLLREIYDRLGSEYKDDVEMSVLSMGMSEDFEVAIEEGSTMIRLGRAIFGSDSRGGNV